MFLFFWIGAVQNRIYQHVRVCKEQASISTIKLSVNGSMCLTHSAMPLHSTVNNREEPDPRKGSCLQTAKLEIYDYLNLLEPRIHDQKSPRCCTMGDKMFALLGLNLALAQSFLAVPHPRNLGIEHLKC